MNTDEDKIREYLTQKEQDSTYKPNRAARRLAAKQQRRTKKRPAGGKVA